MTIETDTRAWRAAIVSVRQGRLDWTPRPAVFLFDTPTGWAWVEPQYAKADGATSFALHERAGQPVRVSGHYAWNDAAADESIEVLQYDPETDGDLIGDTIRWFESYLAAVGRTHAAERERVRAQLTQAGVLVP